MTTFDVLPLTLMVTLLTTLLSVGGNSVQDAYDDHLANLMLEAEKARKSKPLPDIDEVQMTLCFGEFGCYTKVPIGAFPEKPRVIDPKFHLYTKRSEKAVKVYSFNSTVGDEDDETKQSLSNTSKKLVFITHGFGGNGLLDWVRDLRIAKTQLSDDNVIVIDWSKGARTSTLYVGAAANSLLIGRIAAVLAMKLIAEYNIPLANLEFVGFSLGAQVAGSFAKELFRETGEKIGKVTALDCAAPLFEAYGIYPSKEHTHFLEVVHTAAGNVLWRGKVGVGKSFGHIDFYPNGGIYQPGCRIFQVGCAHSRAVQYYVEALTENSKCRYQGFPCDSVENAHEGKCHPRSDAAHFMSMKNCTTEKARIIYFRTRNAKPFCLNNYRLS